jgi:hypothetical protein
VGEGVETGGLGLVVIDYYQKSAAADRPPKFEQSLNAVVL